uniref:Peptidase A2 domain-containing protein n=1 Tax=Glossina morsitans morsitans TaxID=37546 RepID=A0A1B0FAU3_GLOMM
MEEKKYIKRKAKAVAEGNREQIAVSCNHLADFYNQQGRYQDAVKEYQMEAEIYAKMGKHLDTGKAQRMIGEMCMLLGEFDKAKDHITNYLKIVKKLQNTVEEQRAYTTLGRAHLLHGQSLNDVSASEAMSQLKQAEKSFLKALLLVKGLAGKISKLEQLDMQARCYLNIGVVKEHMDDFEESIAYIEKAIKISTSNDIFELTHLCYVSMSLLYHVKKDDAIMSLRYCNLALEVAKRLPQKVKKICETLIIKGEVLIKEGDFASAKQILTKAYKKNTPDENDRKNIEKTLKIVAKICQLLDELIATGIVDYSKRKNLFEKLGDGCCHLGNYSKALEYYHKMLECAELNNESGKSLIPIYVSLYQTYKDNKQYEHALEYLRKEYELNKDEPTEAFSTLCAIADIYEMQLQSFWAIQDILQQAKEYVPRCGDEKTKLEKIIYSRLRKLQIKHDMHSLADELLQEATSKGVDLQSTADDTDTESEFGSTENNTPELGDDICLEDLTDSDTSDLDETDKPRPHRVTRGVRSLTIKRNNKGETQLHQACISGNLELARRLIDQGHVVNVRDHAGWLPLHEACNHGYRDIAELLLVRGAAAAINDKGGTSCDGITPLYDACSNGFLDVVELLLDRGADATVKTDFGETCVDGLDKWRLSATLVQGEQAQYEMIRSRLLNYLSKVGINATQKGKPLTNACSAKQSISATTETSDDSDLPDDEPEVRPSTSLQKHFENRKSRQSLTIKSKFETEYKHIIEQLKHPNHRPPPEEDTTLFAERSSAGKRKSAYLGENEVNEESWLINDMRPDKKKRRFQITRTRSVSTSPTNDIQVSTCWSDFSPPVHETFEDSFQDHQHQKKSKKLTLSRSSSISSNASSKGSHRNKSKQQASLLDSGFCRFRSESPLLRDIDSNDNVHIIEPDSTTTSLNVLKSPLKTSIPNSQAISFLSTSVSFKVKVEDEFLLVPIDRKKLNDVNIRWLAEEASRRYYNLEGLKPLLRLKTLDGFIYAESDPVTVALEQNVLLGTVLEWEICPLAQRYEEMCDHMKQAIDKRIKDELLNGQMSNAINLTNFWLNPMQSKSVFKSLMHQSTLRVIILSNNFIRNEGCRYLAKSLSTLKQLKILNLEGNFITADGLEILLTSLDNVSDVRLEQLILNHNPLGNNAIRVLDKFCTSSQGAEMQKLHLAHCQLSQLLDYDLNYQQLSDFDISFNQLNNESFRKLTKKLNSSRLQSINLSYCCFTRSLGDDFSGENDDIEYVEKISQFFESGTCEHFKRVYLANCQLNDIIMYRIIQCLSKANDLEIIDITDNVKLSTTSFRFILDKFPNLKKLIAINCIRFVSIECIEQIKNIPSYMSLSFITNNAEDNHKELLHRIWRSIWGVKAKIKYFQNNVILYTNDNDFIQY